MTHLLKYLQGNECLSKKNHVVGTVDKALFSHYLNSKANLSIIFNKALKIHLVKLHCYL